ncbi:hypothetical protein, partial [Vibrio anguillarum]
QSPQYNQFISPHSRHQSGTDTITSIASHIAHSNSTSIIGLNSQRHLTNDSQLPQRSSETATQRSFNSNIYDLIVLAKANISPTFSSTEETA